MDTPLDLKEQDGGVTLRVRVKPRASRDRIEGSREGALVVRLTAPPVEGEANAALRRFLGKALGVPASAVELVRGDRGREKLLRVSGLSASAVLERLALAGA